jgi:hypothetical protein
MRLAIQTILSGIGGAILAALFYGPFLALFFSIYDRMFGSFQLADSFFGAWYVDRPVQEGLLLGAIVGILPGLLTGAFLGYFGPQSVLRDALTGTAALAATIALIYFLMLLRRGDGLIFAAYALAGGDLAYMIRFFLVFLVPALATGVACAAILRKAGITSP